MTSTTTARVEVLTAEVRVLMVGSRQVTLSVYGQLDRVYPALIEPFGRVRDRHGKPGFFDVVGRSTRPYDRGALVRSTIPEPWGLEHLRDHGSLPNVSTWGPLARSWREPLRVDWDRLSRLSRDWWTLPLIVLAGLR